MEANESSRCAHGEGLGPRTILRVPVHLIADDNSGQARVAIKPIGPDERDGGVVHAGYRQIGGSIGRHWGGVKEGGGEIMKTGATY